MILKAYLTNHLIIQSGFRSPKYFCAEAIVDDPEELISAVSKTKYYISHIRWWDYVKMGNASPIGYGGRRDPRNPKYYFAETDICRDFGTDTTDKEYHDYLTQIKAMYPNYNVIPAFDIIEKA